MAQSKEFVDASHALNNLSHALALLESENASLQGAVDGLCNENAKMRELVKEMRVCLEDECKRCHEWGDACDLEHQMRELGVEVNG